MSEILARFAELRRADPQRILIYLPAVEKALSASAIWDAHLRYAARIRRSGLEAGSLIISAAGNHHAGVAFLLACRAVGTAIMPVDPGTTVGEIVGLADRFAATALLLPAAMTDHEHFASSTFVEFGGLRLVMCEVAAPRRYLDSAILKLTSGSTGLPKAARANDAQMIGDGTQIAAAMGIRPDDVQMASIPLSHSYGLGVLVMPLLLQGTAIVVRDSFVPPQLPTDARQFGARILPGVPFMFQYFVTNPPPDGWPPGLRQLISAGAPLASTTVRAFHDRFGIKIHSFYGTTETGGIAFDADDEVREEPVVGRPLPGVTITLQTDDPAGARAGRVHVRSTAVASGYTDDSRGGFDQDGYLTGDYGEWDAGHRLTLRGRVSAFVNVAGRKVQPEEVEQVLRAMPGVADVRVVAAPDARRGQQIVACIVAEAGEELSTLDVRQYCASRLAAHKIPRTILFLAAMPLTVRGKTDRAALEDLVRARVRVEDSTL